MGQPPYQLVEDFFLQPYDSEKHNTLMLTFLAPHRRFPRRCKSQAIKGGKNSDTFYEVLLAQPSVCIYAIYMICDIWLYTTLSHKHSVDSLSKDPA